MKVLIAGDYCEKFRVSECISKGEHEKLFSNVKPVIEQADFSIVNFEFPVVINKSNPIDKWGPNLRGQKRAIDFIKYAGFNVCTLANNHILDQGEECCLDTKRLLESEGIQTVGVGDNLQNAKEILYLKKYNETLAVINSCEQEFSNATNSSAGANPLDPVQVYYKIIEAKKNADYVLIIIHGGHEHFQLPSLRMKETYRFFIDAGADVVINHHQHCFSGYEKYNGKLIFYGLGNFLFDNTKRDSIWNEGYMVSVDFNQLLSFDLYPYIQCNDQPGVFLLEEKTKDSFMNKLRELNEIIGDSKLLEDKLTEYYCKCSLGELRSFDLYPGRFLKKIRILGLLPSLLSKKAALQILNHIQCESHRDKMIYALKKYITR